MARAWAFAVSFSLAASLSPVLAIAGDAWRDHLGWLDSLSKAAEHHLWAQRGLKEGGAWFRPHCRGLAMTDESDAEGKTERLNVREIDGETLVYDRSRAAASCLNELAGEGLARVRWRDVGRRHRRRAGGG